jgi:hypothetical protein
VGQVPPKLVLQLLPRPLDDDPSAQADTRAFVSVPPHSTHSGLAGFFERDAASTSKRAPQSLHWYS